MTTFQPILQSLPQVGESSLTSATSLRLDLGYTPKRFFRHGWQSWSLATWLNPSQAPLPVRAAEFRNKDEDQPYALSKNYTGAWVGAVELDIDDILLLGALDLGGRVELEGMTFRGFCEHGYEIQWLIARGKEDEVLSKYVQLLGERFGKSRFKNAPRIWCSWYSLYGWIHELIILNVLKDLGDLPFDVFQIDDGWQLAHGDWEANKKFPSGMKVLADKISAAGRTPGLWLAPFVIAPDSKLIREYPDWLLRGEQGEPVRAGITWSGYPYALDSSHPEVLEWLQQLIQRVHSWGYGYLKLDFLYVGALEGNRRKNIPREIAYRNAMQVIREAAGDAYILACGAPIIPSLGLCDGIRVGPDVAPYWLNKPLAIWLNNPNEASAQNAMRTSLHRLWLRPLVNVDPDVAIFRSRYNALRANEKQLLQDLGRIAGFKATSDLPQWLTASEKNTLQEFLGSNPRIQKMNRYEYQIDERSVDFGPVIPIPSSKVYIPIWLAKYLGLMKIAIYQAIPAILQSKILSSHAFQNKDRDLGGTIDSNC